MDNLATPTPKRKFGLTINIETPSPQKKLNARNKLDGTETALQNYIRHEGIRQEALTVYANISSNTNDSQIERYVLDQLAEQSNMICAHNARAFAVQGQTVPYHIPSHYCVHIYNGMTPDTVVKVYNYMCDDVSEFNIIKEIGAQIYASKVLASRCNFEVPEVGRYGKIELEKMTVEEATNLRINFPSGCIIFFEMSRVTYNSLKDFLLNSDLNDPNFDMMMERLSERLTSIKNCMESDNFYHNDFHQENIFVRPLSSGDFHVSVIDYGLADAINSPNKRHNYTVERLKKIANKRATPSPRPKMERQLLDFGEEEAPINMERRQSVTSSFGDDTIFQGFGGIKRQRKSKNKHLRKKRKGKTRKLIRNRK